jgi:hypothetical protein
VVVLVSAMMQGLSAGRMKRLRQALEIDRRTLVHWREWWMRAFVRGVFWRAERGRFRQPIVEKKMPLGLVECFGLERGEGLVMLMRFLLPITTSSCKGVMAM